MGVRRNIPLKELKAITRVGRRQGGRSLIALQFTTLFHRPISIYFTKLFLVAGITADTVTMLSYMIAVAAGVFFIFGNYGYSLIAIALYQLFIILDCSDGDMSRYMFGVNKNPRGAFLEYFGHSLFEPFLIVCLTFAIYNNPQSTLVGSLFYQNPVVFIIGFIGGNFYLALHVLDGLSKSRSTDAISGEASALPVKRHGLLRYPFAVLSRIRELAQKYNFADPLLLITTVSNTLWLYLIIWGIIHLSLLSMNSVAFYRGLLKPQVLEQGVES